MKGWSCCPSEGWRGPCLHGAEQGCGWAGDCSLESCRPSPFSLPLLSGQFVPWAAIFRLPLAVWFPLGMLSRFWELQLSLGQCERCFASWAGSCAPRHVHQLCCPPAAALARESPRTPLAKAGSASAPGAGRTALSGEGGVELHPKYNSLLQGPSGLSTLWLLQSLGGTRGVGASLGQHSGQLSLPCVHAGSMSPAPSEGSSGQRQKAPPSAWDPREHRAPPRPPPCHPSPSGASPS